MPLGPGLRRDDEFLPAPSIQSQYKAVLSVYANFHQ
jgi:hypothetical protein